VRCWERARAADQSTNTHALHFSEFFLLDSVEGSARQVIAGAGRRAEGGHSGYLPRRVRRLPFSPRAVVGSSPGCPGYPPPAHPSFSFIFIETERTHSAGCRARGAMQLLGVLVLVGGALGGKCCGIRCSQRPPLLPGPPLARCAPAAGPALPPPPPSPRHTSSDLVMLSALVCGWVGGGAE
jgi:hypothetical protein